MLQKITFPTILISRNNDSVEAWIGLSLQSILKGELAWQQSRRGDQSTSYFTRQGVQQLAREAFLHAVSSWPENLTLELNFASLPDLTCRFRGRLLVTFFLRIVSSSEVTAKEEVLSRYFSLKPLLTAHIPEAEFLPITEEEELILRRTPFKSAHGVAVKRRYEAVSLSAPFSRRLSIGFGPMTIKREEGNQVEYRFPWVPTLDDWSLLIETLMGQFDPMQIVIRLQPVNACQPAMDRLSETIRICELFLANSNEHQITLKRSAGIIRDSALRQLNGLAEPCFNLGVFVLAPGPIDGSLGNVLGAAITRRRSGPEAEDLFQGGFVCEDISTDKVFASDYFSESEPFSITEAACAFRLPSPPIKETTGLNVRRSRTGQALLPQYDEATDGAITLAVNEHAGVSQDIRLSAEDLMHHAFIIGATGAGKSTMLSAMALAQIRAGKGLAIIDPLGTMIDSLIGRIPASRIDDVVLVDLLNRDYPIGFNLLEWHTIEERDLIIDELYLTMDRMFDLKQVGGPVWENNFRSMLKLLMGDKPRLNYIPTLLEFILCYQKSNFRDWLKESISDPMTLDFVKELEKTGGECSIANLSPYITSKFSRFVNDTTLQRIIGQSRTTIDFEDIMNTGKILLLKLGKGRFGTNVSGLLVNQIVSRFKIAAMRRSSIPPEKRRDFFLYCDECHHLPPENLNELLAQARQYRLGLILATQYTSQLTGIAGNSRDDLLAGIIGNVGIKVVFATGKDDAEKLAPILFPTFGAADIVGLPKWQGYMSVRTGNGSIPAFSFKTVEDSTPFDEMLESRIMINSINKYGRATKEVDEEIRRRRSVWKE